MTRGRREKCNHCGCRKLKLINNPGHAYRFCEKHQDTHSEKTKIYAIYTQYSTECYWHFSNRVCERVGCKRRDTVYKYRGFFCDDHSNEIKNIRVFKTLPVTIEKEIELRQKEVSVRKQQDIGHIHYINVLINKKEIIDKNIIK